MPTFDELNTYSGFSILVRIMKLWRKFIWIFLFTKIYLIPILWFGKFVSLKVIYKAKMKYFIFILFIPTCSTVYEKWVTRFAHITSREKGKLVWYTTISKKVSNSSHPIHFLFENNPIFLMISPFRCLTEHP